MRATVSILGLYNYNPEVLAGLEVPSGLNRDTLLNYIFMECADLELLYPHIGIMQNLITAWSKARSESWERLYQTTIQKYNMIHNFDRYEEWTDTNSRRDTGGTQTENTNITKQTTNKPGFNISNDTVTTEVDQIDNTNNMHASNTADSKHQGLHTGHLYGNIGVTTPAQMLSSERDLYKWDVYAAIAQEFKERFCVLVY